MFVIDTTEQEFAVLGGLMNCGDPRNDKVSDAVSRLSEASFSSFVTRKAFKALKHLALRGESIDLMTVEHQIKLNGDGDIVPWAVLADWCAKAVGSAWTNSVKVVEQEALRRYAIQKLSESLNEISATNGTTVEKQLEMALATFSEVFARKQQKESRMKHISEHLGNWLDKRDAFLNGGAILGYTTPYENLDEILGVKLVQPGSLVVVGGLPKMGKTKVLTDWLLHGGRNYGGDCLLYTMEMTGEQISERPIQSAGLLSTEKLWSRYVDDEVEARLAIAFKDVLGLPIYIDDTPAVTIEYIEREARMRAAKGKVSLVAVDYLTLMNAPKAERNDLAFGTITKRLKSLAKELNCIVLLLTQLNRGSATRADKRPIPQDSRDTGQIEQDCDLWIGVYRHCIFDESFRYKDITEVLARINRHGGTGTAYMMDKGAYLVAGQKPVDYDSKPEDHKPRRSFE